MAETRLRGQEVVMRLSRGGIVEGTLTAIKDFTVSFDLQSIEEGYLGETEKRFDDIINGCSGSFTVDAESPDLFTLMTFLSDRAARRINPNQQTINATARYQFPSGQSPRLIISNMVFDAIPLAAGARDTYVNATFNYKGPVPRFV